MRPEDTEDTKEGSTGVEAGTTPEREEYLRLVLGAARLLSWQWDLRTGRVRWGGETPSWATLPDRIAPPGGETAPLPLVWPADREKLRRAAVQSLQRDEPGQAEFRVLGPDGDLRWLAAVGRMYRDAEGAPARVVGVLQDITARKATESELGRAARILDGVHDAVISADEEGTITTWNVAAERIYGYTASEAVGRKFAFVFPENDTAQLEAEVLQPTRSKGLHEVVARQRRKDGTEIRVDLRLALLRDDDRDETTGFIACSNDITERVRAEEALREQRESLQTILDSVPAMIWFKDRDNRILRTNRLAAESMGLPAIAIEGSSTYDMYPEEAARYHRDDLEVIRSGRPKLGIIEPLTTGAGEKRWVRTDKVPYRDASGEIVGVIVFAVDVSERIHAEEALRRTQDELERRVEVRTRDLEHAIANLRNQIFERECAEERVRQHQAELAHLLRLHTVEGMAAQLAHEINQPLSAIINFSSGLARRLSSGSGPSEAFEQVSHDIRREAMRAAAVVQRLRDFVRKEAPRREVCGLGQVIREAVLLVDADVRRQGITWRVDVDARLPAIVADRIQIEQVVLNLLRNAIQAIEEAGAGVHEIAVEAEPKANAFVEVRVRDTGIGLPVSEPKRLFEPFFTTKKKGLGMGLSISRSILEAHGGELWAEPNLARGATFFFSLPARP